MVYDLKQKGLKSPAIAEKVRGKFNLWLNHSSNDITGAVRLDLKEAKALIEKALSGTFPY
jgi:hypothetical protein